MLAAGWLSTQVVFNGLVQGTVYGLLAFTILLIYRSSKVTSFAVGNIGLFGSGLFVMLHLKFGVPFWIALLLALAAGSVYGAVLELAVVRRLFTAPRVILLVATIGIAQLSLALLQALPEVEDKTLRYPVAIGSRFQVLGITSVEIPGSYALVLFTAPVIAVGLGWFLNRTLIGRAVRGGASNPDLLRLRGINPKSVSTIVWAIGGLLGTVTMVLVGGINNSSTDLSGLGWATVLRALAAVLIARFTSFPIALVAAMAIGIVEQLLIFNFLDTPGLIDVVLLVVILVLTAVQARTSRGEQDVFAFTPRTDPMPARLRSIWWVRHLDRLVMLCLLGVAIAVPFLVTLPSRQLLYSSILATAICALSMTVLTGWAGQLSLGQMAFAGIGALVAAGFARGLEIDWSIGATQLIYVKFDQMPWGVSVILAAFVCAALAALVGAGALRVRGLLLAVSTFAFALAAGSYLYRQRVLSGGSSTAVKFARGTLFGTALKNQRTYYFVVLGALAIVVAVLGRVRRSGVGRVTLAVRDNPTAAAAYTVNPAVAKLRAFALAGFIAGLGGALLVGVGSQLKFNDTRFLVDGSLLLVSIVVIGGMGSATGALIGTLWVVGLPAFAPENKLVPLLVSSVGLLVLLLYFPGGFADIGYRLRSWLYRRLEAKLPPVTKSTTAPPVALSRSIRPGPAGDIALRTTGVVVSFGGVKANDAVSIEVRHGEIVGLIGTNGAGKTTLMNAIGGYVPSTGRIELLGTDVSGANASRRARRGLGRTFQSATLFPELSVRETVEVALEARGRSSLIGTLVFSPRTAARGRAQAREADELIDFLGLGRYADRAISELSTGTRRIVELAGLLALDARVLCLDEPTAGIAQRETEAMGPLLVQIRKELDASMLIIEHDMPLIMSMSDRVYCLEAGRVIAEGAPAEVRNDPAVIASYLGLDDRAIQRSGHHAARTDH